MRVEIYGSLMSFALCSMIGCLNAADHELCESNCRRLDDCHLLPSPLGVSRNDCERQCNSSDSDTIATLGTCLNAPVSGDANVKWCDSAQSKPGWCAQASECLSRALPDKQLLGRTSLELQLYSATNLAAIDSAITACTPDLDLDAGVEAPVCGTLDVVAAEFFVEVRGERRATGMMSCAPALATPTVFEKLQPGPALAGVKLYWGSASAPQVGCAVFYHNSVLAAGKVARWKLQVPDNAAAVRNWPLRCESSSACNNGMDDDNDGQIDCADLECAATEGCPHSLSNVVEGVDAGVESL